MVCFDTPSSRPTSAALRPASICFNAPIISTSLYFLFVMPTPPPRFLRPCLQSRNHILLCAEFGVKVKANLYVRWRWPIPVLTTGYTIDGTTYTVDNAGNRTSKTDQRLG